MTKNQVGTVHESNVIEWKIPIIREWSQGGYNWVRSPDVITDLMTWHFFLSSDSEEWIGIFVHGDELLYNERITYTLRLQDRYGIVEITETVECRDCTLGVSEFLKIEKGLKRIFRYPATVTCLINFETCLPLQAGKVITHYFEKTAVPDSVSCAIQTEDASSMTDKENGKGDDRSSLDKKAGKVATHHFDKTAVPHSVSCAIQTEDASSTIDKENSEDENWSSLDTKDDALLRERMKELLTKGCDYDVTICVQDKEFRAHRNILSARSPVFAMMLSHDTKESNTSTISIEDCDPESFDEFLLYVYSGRTENLSPSNALQLYYPADKYNFPVLKERCVSLLKASMSITSICDVVLLAAKHQEKELLEVATEFFARNIKKIIITVGWQNFLSQNPVEANELYIKSMEILLPEN